MVLVVFSGLPGVGKSTIARRVSALLEAAYLRVDSVEQAIRSSEFVTERVVDAGYLALCRVAADNLALGRRVVCDSVNPLVITRQMYHRVGEEAGVRVMDVEVVCSDAVEHQRRVETRAAEVAGLALPSWQDVLEREFEPWTSDRIRVDTALLSAESAADQIVKAAVSPYG